MPKEDMDSPMGFILALESSMKGEKMDSEDAPVEKPEMAKSDGPDPKEDKAPEDMGDKKERAAELFSVIFGSDFDEESEGQKMLLDQIMKNMEDPSFKDLNPNQFALKMLKGM